MAMALDAPGRPVRATRRALHSRVSAGHVAMIVAGMIGVLATLAVLRASDHRVEVLVARHDLAPGTIVGSATFRTVRVGADASALRSFVRATDASGLVGKVVTTPVAAGGFVSAGDVQTAGAGKARRSMSFPIARSHALDGTLVAGDRVDVVAVDARSTVAKYVATNSEVLRVDNGGGSGPLRVSDGITVTLAVDSHTALAIATAVHGNELTLVRSTGAAPLDATSAAVGEAASK